jgi:hypothetical protein
MSPPRREGTRRPKQPVFERGATHRYWTCDFLSVNAHPGCRFEYVIENDPTLASGPAGMLAFRACDHKTLILRGIDCHGWMRDSLLLACIDLFFEES